MLGYIGEKTGIESNERDGVTYTRKRQIGGEWERERERDRDEENKKTEKSREIERKSREERDRGQEIGME